MHQLEFGQGVETENGREDKRQRAWPLRSWSGLSLALVVTITPLLEAGH